MNKVSITTENTNSKLIINNPIVTESIDTTELNVTSDIYVNGAEYTPVGSLLTYAGLTAPTGWLFCNGAEVSKSAYPRLFTVIGNLYGTPANSSNFVLPNLAERIPVGKSNTNSVANSGGNSSITLSVGQLPSHTHTGTTDVSGTHAHTGTTDVSGTHAHTGTTDVSGTHAHTGTTDANGTHSHDITDPGHTHSQTTINDDFNNSGANPPGFSADSAGSRTWNNISSSTTGISINSAGSHAHTFTSDNAGSHAHTFTSDTAGSHAHTFTSQTAGSHAHTFTTGSTGNGDSIDIRNKFIVMNYMIRY